MTKVVTVELPETEAREVMIWLARDQEASSLPVELRTTRKALAGFEAGIRLPESREFFWSKIEREILRQQQPEPARAPRWSSAGWRRFFVPAAALAALVLAGFLANVQFGFLGSVGGGPAAESALADPEAFTYRDYAAGTTLVWLSYPAENELADNEPADNLQ